MEPCSVSSRPESFRVAEVLRRVTRSPSGWLSGRPAAKLARVLRAATVRPVLATLAFCLLGPPRAAAAGGLVLADLPAAIDPHANYLIYLHGRIIEKEGPHPTSP